MGRGVTSRVICPSESTVAGFLERRLSLAQRADLEGHIDDCASCRRLLIELSSGLQLLSAVAEAHPTHPVRPAVDGEMLAKGTVVGRFVVLDLLGRGGMGAVYRAYDPQLDRKVALKLVRPGVAEIGGIRAHLLREAQVMARICHANVIAIYDVGSYREQVFAAMELVEGTTLRRWMAERRRTWREVVEVFVPAGEGLAAAHTAGVVHRDFKPENVLLGDDGRVKVSDFGLATQPQPATAHIAGTPGYLAIEALQFGRVDERGDQFSFCVALHEALHGRRPFAAQALDELIAEVRRGPALEGRRVPARLNRIVRHGLAPDPEARYRSMRELLADLRRAVTAHRRRRLAAAVVVALTLAVGATATVMNGRTAVRPSCADTPALLAGVWDSERRDAVRTAFRRTPTPQAEASFEGAAATLDRYAAAWVAIRREVCEATMVRRDQPPALLELRTACLDRRRIELRALVDELVAGDAHAVQSALPAAAALPALASCSDMDALRAIVSSPLARAVRTQIGIPAGVFDKRSARSDAASIEAAAATRPDFRLPFGCGETWQMDNTTHRSSHGEADFVLPGDEASAEMAVFVSAPGWVSRVIPDNGEVDIAHGDGWFSTYQHMTDIAISLHQYVGRGQMLGRVGNVNVKNVLGEPGLDHLHYEQMYAPGVANPTFDHSRASESVPLYLERERVDLSATGRQILVSTNNCPAGGVPGSVAQYEVPVAAGLLSPSRPTMEIMTRRSSDGALFERWYDGWWRGGAMPHTIVGRPAVAVFRGELHVIARKSDGTILDLTYSPFTGWRTTYLEGKVSGDPDVAVFGHNNNLHVAARGTDGFPYHWWTSATGSWSHPARMASTQMVGTPAQLGHHRSFYIVVRAADNSLWSWKARGGQWIESQLPGAVSDDPSIGVDPRSGLVNVVARGVDNRIHRWQSKDPDRSSGPVYEGWSEPELVDSDHLVTGAPATAVYHGAMHIFARDLGGAIHHWSKDETWHWETTGGAYTANPDVVPFGDQLQTAGRGANGSLYTVWYDPQSGFWNVEHQDVAVSD